MTERRFPILDGGGETIPWNLAQQAYRNYGNSQSLQQVAKRGGFGWTELDAMLRDTYSGRDRKFERDVSVARERVLSHDKSLLSECNRLKIELLWALQNLEMPIDEENPDTIKHIRTIRDMLGLNPGNHKIINECNRSQ